MANKDTTNGQKELLQYAPTSIDQRAEATPNRPFAIVPNGKSVEDGYQEVTYSQLARAINKASWWLDAQINSRVPREALTYHGPDDLRWAILLFAAQKTHRQFILLNPNNSLEADLSLLAQRKCNYIFAADGAESRFKHILKKRLEAHVVVAPELEHLLNDEPVPLYQYKLPDDELEPWKVTHTSGTTGLPKTIDFHVGYQLLMAKQRLVSDRALLEGVNLCAALTGKRMLLPFPQTWSAGSAFVTELAIAWEVIPVLPPLGAPHPLPVDVIHEVMKNVDVDVALLLPFHIREILKRPDLLDFIKSKKLFMVGYAGAGLDLESGNKFSQYARLQAFYGDTTVGNTPHLVCDPEDWQYVGMSEKSGHCLVPYEDAPEHEKTEVFELVYKREQDIYGQVYLFKTHPELNVFHNRDLFKKHPTKPNFWLKIGRADDLNKNTNLTKFHSSNVEAILERHEHVRGAMMGGEGEERPFLLLEVDDRLQALDRDAAIDDLWPAIKEANKTMTDEIQIKRWRVLIASSAKPLQRLGKGTLDRRAVLAAYKDEIAGLET